MRLFYFAYKNRPPFTRWPSEKQTFKGFTLKGLYHCNAYRTI
nr:MAG TPA: hypothetical protein [Caudoviricetes sp.]